MPWQTARKDPAYGKAAWRRARQRCLEQARWRCEIKGPSCRGAAVTVDHIYGLAADPGHRHLQAACQPCHDAKTHRESGEARRRKQATPDPECTPRTQW
jgi:5-methylcytosine-specific restriction enzyme A